LKDRYANKTFKLKKKMIKKINLEVKIKIKDILIMIKKKWKSKAKLKIFKWNIISTITGFTKLPMGLVVLVKKMSVHINFLLQNTNLVSVLNKICHNYFVLLIVDWILN
jgi:hypothetical protein